jgi:hypothetical protein
VPEYELYVDGVSMGTVTPSAAWSDNGPERVNFGATNLGVASSRVGLIDAAYWGRRLTGDEIAAYDARVLRGDETDLLASWHCQEGSGATAADQAGTADIVVTGATWSAIANPTAAWSVDRATWGPWSSRQALKLKPGTWWKSPDLGVVPRHGTLAMAIVWPADAPAVDGGILGWMGASEAGAMIRLETAAAGKVLARSLRAGDVTVTSDAALDDGELYFLRATLDGQTGELNLYVGGDGVAEVTQGTPATAGAYPGGASSYHGAGDSTETTEVAYVLTADHRAYDAVVLAAEDPMSSDSARWVRGAWSLVACNGTIQDAVDPSRVFTEGDTPAYGRIVQASEDSLEAGDALLYDGADDPFAGLPRLIGDYQATADAEVSQVWVEMSDPGASYVQIGTLHAAGTLRPPLGLESTGAVRSFTAPAVQRSGRGGAVGLGEGYYAAGHRGALKIDSGRCSAAMLPHVRELQARLLRHRDPSRLVALWALPRVLPAAHRLIEYLVVGICKTDAVTASDDVFDVVTLDVEGVL